MFSEKVIKLFDKPKNVGIIKCASGSGASGSVEAGQLIKIYLKIEDDVVKDARYKAYGGVLTIASCSALTTMIVGMSLDKVKLVTCEDVLAELDMQNDSFCNEIDVCIDALISALSEYYKNQLEK